MQRRVRHQLIVLLACSLARLIATGAAAIGGLTSAARIGRNRGLEEQGDSDSATTERVPDDETEVASAEELVSAEPPSASHAEATKQHDIEVAPEDDSSVNGVEEDENLSVFDFEAFFMRILTARDLYNTLAEIAREIRDCGDDACGVERFLLRQLEEERIVYHESRLSVERQDSNAVPPQPTLLWRSGSVYLRMNESTPYGAYLQALRVEALLNVMRLAQQSDIDASLASSEDMYKLRLRFLQSVCTQSPFVDTADWSYLAMPWQGPIGPAEHGEWSVRHAIAEAVESVRLPYRLDVQYRTNVSGGDVAIEMAYVPPQVFPRTSYVAGLGVVPTTSHMRKRMASEYAVRVGLLIAAHAFHASNRVSRVWVSSIEQTPSKRRCMYSACWERRSFATINMRHIRTPLATLNALGGNHRIDNEALTPCEPLFSIEDERFCPAMRHDLWRLSERVLSNPAAQALGTSRVSGLAIHEELPRILAAEEAMRLMPSENDSYATERCVKAVLAAAGGMSDPDVWDAATYVVNLLIDGLLDPTDAESLYESFVMHNEARVGLERAQKKLLESGAAQAIRHLERTLEPSTREGRFQDTPVISYRSFGSFTERILYNRAHAHDNKSVILIPDDYVAAHLSVSALSLGPDAPVEIVERALQHARWALEHAPFSATAHQTAAACLERLGRYEDARDQLKSYLGIAYQLRSIGIAYHRLAVLFHELDEPRVCQACYQRCLQVFPELMPIVLAECQSLVSNGATFEDAMEPDVVDAVLEGAGIPLAPTQDTVNALFEASVAAIDAEVFPVARELMQAIASLTHDDVMLDIYRSIENEPDT